MKRKLYINTKISQIDGYLSSKFKDYLTLNREDADILVLSFNSSENIEEIIEKISHDITKELVLLLDTPQSKLAVFSINKGFKNIFTNPITLSDVSNRIEELLNAEKFDRELPKSKLVTERTAKVVAINNLENNNHKEESLWGEKQEYTIDNKKDIEDKPCDEDALLESLVNKVKNAGSTIDGLKKKIADLERELDIYKAKCKKYEAVLFELNKVFEG